MVDFGQATFIDGTVIPGAELRRNTQRDAGVGSGVARPGDLKISQMDVPGAGVKIAAGDALVQSRAPGAGRETYGVPLLTDQSYLGDGGGGIPGTGSSVPSGGRRDMVFLEILDSGLPTSFTPKVNWPVGQSAKLSIIQNVPATARTIADVPTLANITGYALALITYPASTTTITDAMITDLREVHSPKSLRRMVTLYPTGVRPIPTGGYSSWPLLSSDRPTVRVPEGATQVKILSIIMGAKFTPAGAVATVAGIRTGFATTDPGQNTILVEDAGSSAGRNLYAVVGTHNISPALWGTDQLINIQAQRTAGTGAWEADYQTSVIIDYEFIGVF